MIVSTLIATPDPEPEPKGWLQVFADTDRRELARSMARHPSAQHGRVARGSYRRHPHGLFIVDGSGPAA